jgi:CBS domain-containing protein
LIAAKEANMREYSSLKLTPLASGARVAEPMAPGRVTLDDPAFSVMTDLREVSAATTRPEETIDAAHAQMIRRAVRLLFVLDDDGAVVGVITATDLLGEKPVRYMRDRGISHAEILVADIMTPASMLEALPIQDVAQMRVGHIVATLQAVGRKHITVAEEGGRRIRGLFSSSQVARQLGVDLQTFEVARSFADIEAALVR